MGDIFTNLKRTFNSGNILAKLIYINVGLFVIIRLASVILMLFNLGGFPFLQYLQVPSSPELLLYRPWTIITYIPNFSKCLARRSLTKSQFTTRKNSLM